MWWVLLGACSAQKDDFGAGGSNDEGVSHGTFADDSSSFDDDTTPRRTDDSGPTDDSAATGDSGGGGTTVDGTTPTVLPESCDPTVVAAALPNLIPCGIDRQWPNFHVYFCNAS